MGKTRDGIVRDIYVTDPWQIHRELFAWLAKDRMETDILFKNLSFCWNPWRPSDNPWRMKAKFALKTKFRDGLAIIIATW